MSSKISFDDVGAVLASFFVAEGVAHGAAVTLTGEETVGVAADKKICGVAYAPASDSIAAVQVAGFATVNVSGAALTAGWENLTGDGTGSVKKAAAGETSRAYLVVSADATAKTAVILL